MPEEYNITVEFAKRADLVDELAGFKKQFHFPQHNGKDTIYFCGNSLGLQPLAVADAMNIELGSWRELAIGGYYNGPNPWLYYQEYCRSSLAKIVGCLENEVTVMNALTVNLQLLMLGFYRPTPTRFRIIMEAGAFPSDQYAVETLARHFGLNPDEVIVEIAPMS